MNRIRIAIADDCSIFRDGLKAILSSEDDMEVVLEAADGEQLIKGLEKVPVDITILDLKMPIVDGKQATQLIRNQHPSIKILILSMYADDLFVTKLREIGAHGYLLKESSPEEIRKSIRTILKENNHGNNY